MNLLPSNLLFFVIESPSISRLHLNAAKTRKMYINPSSIHKPVANNIRSQHDGLLHDQHDGFTSSLLESLFSKGLRTVKSIPPKCHLGFSRVLKGALDKVISKPDDISCWEESIINAIRSWTMPGGSLQLVRETLAESSSPMLDVDEGDLDLSEQNIKQCKRKICDRHYTAAVRVLSSSGVAPYNDATLQKLKAKHPFKSAPTLPDAPIDHHHLIASQTMVLDRIKSFPRGTSCGWDGLRAQHLMDCLSGAAVAISDELISSITQVVNLFLKGKCPMTLGEYLANAPLTPLVKPGGGIRPIAVGIVWRRLVSKVSATMIGHSLDGYLDDLQFGVGVSRGGEAILHAVNRLVEDRRDDVGLSMLLVDFQNAFNLVDRKVMLEEVRMRCPAWYHDDGTIVGDTLVVGKVLELIAEDGLRRGLHLNVDKTEIFWPKEDPRSRVESVFPPNISQPLHGVKLLGGAVSVDFGFSSEFVMKRVSKTIMLIDAVAKINDPQCELLLLRVCKGISKLYFAMRACPSRVFESAQHSFDVAIRSALERISVALQTKLLRHVGIVASGSTFDDALSVFNTSIEIDFFCNPSGFMAISKGGPHLSLALGGSDFRVGTDYERIIGIKHRHNVVRDTLVDICFRSGISAGKEVDIGLGGGRDKALRPADILLYSWDGGLDVCMDLKGSSLLTQTGMADYVSGRAVTEAAQRKRVKYEVKYADIGYGFLPFSFSSFEVLEKDAVTLLKRIRKFSIAQDNGARAAVHIFNKISFSIAKRVSSYFLFRSLVQPVQGDIYEDHVVSCAGVIGIKHRHNVVRDTFVDICCRSGVSAGKEADIGLDMGRDKPLRRADMLLYSWDRGLDVCVDLTGSSPLTQTGMVDFVPGRAVIDDAQRKRGKYMDKCASIGYGFLLFSFSSLGELEADAVTLLKRI
ncbi:hypothetical protein Tco_1500607 [Tanacetum coccineum]